jgi:hypothetical protein
MRALGLSGRGPRPAQKGAHHRGGTVAAAG